MISIKHLSGSAEAVANYAEHQQEETREGTLLGYYENESEAQGKAPSFWHGKAASRLGLADGVESDDLVRLLNAEGFNRLNHDKRRLGTDMTFSAPKSVSLVALSGNDSKISQAHDRAVKLALDYLEKEVFCTRTGKGGTSKEFTGNIAAAVFRHEDGRAENGVADPVLHSHAIIANLTQKENGDWRTTDRDFGPNNERWYLADSIYKAELGRLVREAGYEIYQTDDGFEIEGVDRETIENFSNRKRSIDEQLAKWGLEREGTDAETRTRANLVSRGSKSQLSQSEQRAEWAERAREAGLDFKAIRELGHEREEVSPEQREAANRKALFEAIEHLGERNDTFSDAEVMSDILKERYGLMTYDDAKAIVRDATEKGWLIETEKGSGHFTSAQAVEREGWMAGFVRAGNGKARAVMTGEQAQKRMAKAEKEQGFAFSDGQREALSMALTSENQVMGIVGAAGAGKTTAMAPAALAFKEAGYEVVGLGPSAKAAKELESANADETRTIASYLMKERKRSEVPSRPRMIILDEAGMVSSADMQAVMKTLHKDDRLLLVGDHRQLQSVLSGKAFEYLQDEGLETATIAEIRRQTDARQREVVELFSQGRSEEAAVKAKAFMEEIKDLAKKSMTATQKARARQSAIAIEAAEKWLALKPEDRDRTIVMSATNRVRHQINQHIREGMIDEGQIGESMGKVTVRESIDLESGRDRARASSYLPRKTNDIEPEDRLMIVTATGQEYEVESINRKENTLTLRGLNKKTHEKDYRITLDAKHLKDSRAYKVVDLEINHRERIQFRENDKKLGVVNGDVGTVIGQDKKSGLLEIRLDGRPEGSDIIHVDRERAGVMEHAYCRTVHSAQGATEDRAIVAGEGGRVATANIGYVAMSRQRFDIEVVTDSKDKLSAGYAKQAAREGATERHERNRAEGRVTNAKLEAAKQRGIAAGKREQGEGRSYARGAGGPALSPGGKGRKPGGRGERETEIEMG